MNESWEIQEHGRNRHKISWDSPIGETHRILLISDVHWDNPKCDRKLLKKHLEEAKKCNAPVFINGDLFCAMQGKGDPRSCKYQLRPEHLKGHYLDSIISTAIDWFEPYKDILALCALGNHETKIKDYKETDLMERFTEGMRQRGGIVRAGGYQGWLNLAFNHGDGKRNAHRASRVLHYEHGSGGSSPVNKGVTARSRVRDMINADIYVTGHVHHKAHVPYIVEQLTNKMQVERLEIHFLCLGTYKDDWGDGHSGFAVERRFGPRPLGGFWLDLTLNRKNRIDVDVREAK